MQAEIFCLLTPSCSLVRSAEALKATYRTGDDKCFLQKVSEEGGCFWGRVVLEQAIPQTSKPIPQIFMLEAWASEEEEAWELLLELQTGSLLLYLLGPH